MKIAVVFGGKSSEHTISVATGVQAFNALKTRHDVIPVYVDRDGVWRWGKPNATPVLKRLKRGKRIAFSCGSPYFIVRGRRKKVDCALLCLHGANGEDGSAQGLLKLAGIPFSGCGVVSSAIGLDKAFCKAVFSAAKLPQTEYVCVKKQEYDQSSECVVERLTAFGLPFIVKPAGAGSSIGITVVKTEQSIDRALKTAFSYDGKVVVERLVEGFTEVNCAVLKVGGRTVVSDVEQPAKKGDFLDYRDKYAFGSKLSLHQVPAHIDEKTTKKIKDYALRAFTAIDGAGVARVDFMIDGAGKILVNEINTIPGSLAFYLFVTSRLSPEKLCELLIEDALYEARQRGALTTEFEGELWATKS